MMREWLELDTSEICKALDITAGHCNVMLFRARIRLRECVEQHWFCGQVDGRRPGTERTVLSAG
jgi:RNA polymerase sigma-70 factor (ECF subfamily)